MSIVEVDNEQDFQQKVLQAQVPVFVDFYADWCPPCRKMGELFHNMIGESKGWIVAKLNCDKQGVKPLAQKHGVSGIPAIFFYHKGNLDQAHSFTGYDQQGLLKAIEHANSLC